MNKLKIRKSNLCFRFYTSDGWSRTAVASYINHPDAIKYVIPRYFDYEKDDAISLEIGWIYLDEIGLYSDCDYFAIHNFSIEGLLDIEKLSKEHIFV